MRLLRLDERPQNLQPWLDLIQRIHHPAGEARIAIVGKYVQLEDAYKSLREALLHGGLAHNHKTVIGWIESEEIDSYETAADRLRGYDGILVPGGFGKRGIQGMIYTIQFAREHKIPFFGICLGMQCATIEYARDVAGLKKADSTEFDPQSPYRVIYKLRELLGVDEMGGTMRLGAWPCKLEPGSFAHKAYGKLEISERHRHRYEFNREYEEQMTAAGLRISGGLALIAAVLVPTGIEMAGSPVMLPGIVSAPVSNGFTSTSPTLWGIGPSALNASYGFVAQITTSTWSKMSATASLSLTRKDSRFAACSAR